jgi:L-lactate dehydrogenase complex protein LldF
LHELLLENRSEAVNSGYTSFGEKFAWKMWKRASLNRSMMNMSNGNMKNFIVNNIFKGWKKHRGELHFSKKTFSEMWKERFKG